jgi:hypothetical protein
MNIIQAIETLRQRFGSHEKAAHYLGITARQYYAWRKGKIPDRQKRYVVLVAENLPEKTKER